MENKESARGIARLNDEFRRQAGLMLSDTCGVPGRCFMTSGIAALERESQAEILARVREFSTFEPGNDPHGEHDFGSLSAPNGDRVFWKIDYYADSDMEYGSEVPSDPTRSFRVLTIMLAAEY